MNDKNESPADVAPVPSGHHLWAFSSKLGGELCGICGVSKTPRTMVARCPYIPGSRPMQISQVVFEVIEERARQVALGWTAEHDDEHVNDEIAAFACYYLMPDGARDWDASSTGYGATLGEAILPEGFPGAPGSSRRRDLVKAAALAIAEIERLDRAEAAAAAAKGGAV